MYARHHDTADLLALGGMRARETRARLRCPCYLPLEEKTDVDVESMRDAKDGTEYAVSD